MKISGYGMREPGGGERRVSGRVVLIFLAIAALTGLLLVYASFDLLTKPSNNARMTGSLFVSDAGQAKGGFEYTATYNATLTVTGGRGTLNLSLSVGLGDALERQVYAVSNLIVNSTSLSMSLDGTPVRLVWTSTDTIWNGSFNNYYIASWGGSAPQDELRGVIGPSVFPGLSSHHYVELRLMPVQPNSAPSF